MAIEIESYALSDIGKVRENNEDFFLHLPKHNLFTVADGMGGHNAGEVAAKEATHGFLSSFLNYLKKSEELSHEKINLFLTQAMDQTNQHVLHLANTHPSYEGMGTTLSCLYLHEKIAHYVHVGDSRIYQFRENKLTRLTNDHTSIKTHINPLMPTPHVNAITKAIGVSPKIKPDIDSVDLQEKDIFLICSDGLHDFVSDADLERIIGAKSSKIVELADDLINQAKINTSHDNITLILLKIHKLS